MSRNRTVARRAIIQIAGGAVGAIEYFVLDEFCTTDSSPITTPRTAEPGPGGWLSTDVDSVNSISGEKYLHRGPSVAGWSKSGLVSDLSFTRVPGLAYLLGVNWTTSATALLGFTSIQDAGNSGYNNRGLRIDTNAAYANITSLANSPQILALTNGVDYRFATISRAIGRLILGQVAGEDWQLLYMDEINSTATLYAGATAFATAYSGDYDTKRVLRLPASFIKPVVSDSYSLIPTIADSGSNGLDGTPVRVGLNGSAGYGDGSKSYTQLPAAAMDTAGFDGAECGIAIRGQVNSADFWTDGLTRFLMTIGVDASNQQNIRSTAGDNNLTVRTIQGGTTKAITITTSTTSQFGVGMTVSESAGGSGEMKVFFNGTQSGSTQTGLGTFAGTIVNSGSVIGAINNTPSNVWSGLYLEAIVTLNSVVPTETQSNFITNTANTITDAYLDTEFGAGNWMRLPINEQYVTDGLGHLEADGRGAGKTRNGATFSSAGSDRFNGAVGGADVIITGDFASDSDWDKGTGWTIAAGIASKAAGVASDLGQTVDPLTANTWNKLIYTTSGRTAGTITPKFGTAAGVARSTNATFTETVRSNAAAFDLSADSTFDGDIDDVIVNPISLIDLLDLADSSIAEHIVRADLTITDDTQGGVGLSYDSASSPASGLNIYYDRIDDKVKAEKWDSGAFVAEIMSVAKTYSATGKIEARWSDTNSDGTYDLHVIYNGEFVGVATVSDANIINNTNIGLFSLLEGGLGELENTWNANDGVVNDILDLAAAPRTCPEVTAFTEGFDAGYE